MLAPIASELSMNPLNKRRGGPVPSVTLEHLLALCDRFYEKNGFVKWSEVAEVVGLSRQAIQLRLKGAVERGLITQEQVDRYRSMSSRVATTREKREASREAESRRLSVMFTEENIEWLREESVIRGVRIPDIINGLVNRAREAKPVGTF